MISILADVVEWLDGLGWTWIEDRERELAGFLRAALRTVPGVTLLTPDRWDWSSAITSFSMEGTDALDLQKWLWEQRIVTRYVSERNGIRIATPYFTNEEDLDHLVDALRRRAC